LCAQAHHAKQRVDLGSRYLRAQIYGAGPISDPIDILPLAEGGGGPSWWFPSMSPPLLWCLLVISEPPPPDLYHLPLSPPLQVDHLPLHLPPTAICPRLHLSPLPVTYLIPLHPFVAAYMSSTHLYVISISIPPIIFDHVFLPRTPSHLHLGILSPLCPLPQSLLCLCIIVPYHFAFVLSHLSAHELCRLCFPDRLPSTTSVHMVASRLISTSIASIIPARSSSTSAHMTPLQAIRQNSNNEEEVATSYKCGANLGLPDPEEAVIEAGDGG
jgi:hypothetical protein